MMERLLTVLPFRAWMGSGVVLAVSGGADSVALLRFFAELRARDSVSGACAGKLAVAHLNHALRGKESDEDAKFVGHLAERFSFDYHEGKVGPEEWTRDATGSFEAAARNFRYDFLLKTAERLGFRHVAVAHTRNDQAETILHRIVRGTGISGLAGMNRVRVLSDAVTLIRPFLACRREELLAYLRELRQDYRTDSSNMSPQWTRNRIRLNLLPQLKHEYNPAVAEALEHLGILAGEVRDVIEELIDRLAERAVVSDSARETVLDCAVLRREKPYVVREFLVSLWKARSWPLRAMGFAEWTALETFVRDGRESSKKAARFFPGDIGAVYDSRSDVLRLSRND